METQAPDIEDKVIEDIQTQITRNRLRTAAIHLRERHADENGLLVNQLNGQPLGLATIVQTAGGNENLEALLSDGMVRQVVEGGSTNFVLNVNKLLNEVLRLFFVDSK